MKKLLFILLCSQGFYMFSQNLEEQIYVATETFMAKPSQTSFQVLSQQESIFKNQVTSKGEQLALVFLQSHKGYYLDSHSRLDEAIATFEDAVKRFNEYNLSKLYDFDIIESCLIPLGNLYIKTGDYTNAESTINQYLYLAKQNKNMPHQISGYINLSILFQTLGNHKAVIKIIDNALKTHHIPALKKARLQRIKNTSLMALNKTEMSSTQNGASNSNSFDAFINNYQIELQKKNYKGALTYLKKAKTLINEAHLDHRNLAKFYFQEAQLYYTLKNSDETLKKLNKALTQLLPKHNTERLPDKNLLYAENTFIDIFDLYAEIQTNPDKALQSFDLSFHVSELLRDSWTTQEAKILNEGNNRLRSEKCIDILFDYYDQTKHKPLLFKALLYAENNKASTLKEIFKKKLRLQRFPNDSLLIKEFNLLKQQEQVTTWLTKERLGKNNASTINLLNKQLSDISVQLKAIKKAISKSFPENKNRFTLQNLQSKLLHDDAALTEYFFGKNNLYQFIISAKDIFLNRIPLDEKNKQAIINFIHFFDGPSVINNNIEHYTEQAFNIYRLLNVTALSSYKNVIIIPDGTLNFIPFEALLTSSTNTSSFSKMPFMVKNHNVVYNTSISFYLNKTENSPNRNVLGFFPVFKNTNLALSYSINEAKAIQEEMPSKIFMNADASKNNFKKYASKYGIIHLSTHANGGNVIIPANMQFYNNTLLLNELYSMDIPANLVVLSACETGVGKQYKGEGAMSIARGFQYGGTRSLLFSLWQINDLSTSQIMQSFYGNLKKNQSAFLSNRQSKLDYIENKSISNIKKSPYYWSAFVYYGPLDSVKSQNFVFYAFLGVLIIFIALFLFFKNKDNGHNASTISS